MKRKPNIVREYNPDELSPAALIRSVGLHLEAAQTASLQLREQIAMIPLLLNETDKELATVRVTLKSLAKKINRKNA